MAKNKGASPNWIDVKASLLTFDRAGLYGLLRDLYAASRENRAFFHARLGLGPDQIAPYKAEISRRLNPDLGKAQPVSVSKAKKAIADYRKAIGLPEGLAELSTFFCEEACSFVESCSFRDEGYFAALIRMYGESVKLVGDLPRAARRPYLERLDKLRSRSENIAYGVQDELNTLWYDAGFDRRWE